MAILLYMGVACYHPTDALHMLSWPSGFACYITDFAAQALQLPPNMVYFILEQETPLADTHCCPLCTK